MAINLTRRQFTVAEYHQMAEAGILKEDDRVELIDGEVVYMTPTGRLHASVEQGIITSIANRDPKAIEPSGLRVVVSRFPPKHFPIR